MDKSYDWVVMGGGFRSIVAAYAFAKFGKSVAIIERGDKLGGFLSPIKWQNFWIDKGPQFFENFESNDVEFLEEMTGQGVLKEIGFAYSSYINGKKTDDFAIPDWRSYGEAFSKNVFDELLNLHLKKMELGTTAPDYHSLSDLIEQDGGTALNEPLHGFCQKFLRQPAGNLNARAGSLVSFLGRKLLFGQDISLDLKKSPIIDGILAAQKVQVGETRYNLYPKGSSLETVRSAMDSALERVGVDAHLKTTVSKIDLDENLLHTDQHTIRFRQLFWGCDIRDTEASLTGNRSIADQTHILPEIFHCFVVPTDKVDGAYYVVDYDSDHLSTRMTNFCNYMGSADEEGYGVICVEQPIDEGSPEWENPEKDREQIFAETIESGNLAETEYKMARSFRIPSTYKVPKREIHQHIEAFMNKMTAKYGDKIIIPDPYTLTRKQAMDDLREMKII